MNMASPICYASVRCDPEYFSTFMVSSLGLLGLGIILGHVSQSSWKLFRILTKFFFYLCLPCIAIYCPIAVKMGPEDLKSYDTIFQTIRNCTLFWFITLGVFGLFALYKSDRGILLHGALTAQFIITTNQLSFGKKLLESSCYNASHNGTKIKPYIDFNFLVLPDLLVPFLMFLPLTNGIVMMSKQPLCLKNFLLSVVSQVAKMGLSYSGLAVGLVIHHILDRLQIDDNYRIKHYFSLSIDIITLSGTIMLILTGVYMYHILVNMELGHTNIKLCVILVIVTSIGVTLVSMVFHDIDFHTQDVVILICRTCMPPSLYVQYYIHKHTNKIANYILSFVGSIFLGILLMYVTILDYSVISNNSSMGNASSKPPTPRMSITIPNGRSFS